MKKRKKVVFRKILRSPKRRVVLHIKNKGTAPYKNLYFDKEFERKNLKKEFEFEKDHFFDEE